METHPKFHSWKTQNSSFICMDNLKNRAAAGGSLCKYAAGNASVLNQFQNLYAFAQCTPDLSQLDCNNCLDEAFGGIPQYNRSVGGRVFTPTCNFRYEVYPFKGHDYDAPPASRLQSTTLSPPATATNSKTRKVTGQRCRRRWLEQISEDLPSYVSVRSTRSPCRQSQKPDRRKKTMRICPNYALRTCCNFIPCNHFRQRTDHPTTIFALILVLGVPAWWPISALCGASYYEVKSCIGWPERVAEQVRRW
ncbi:hypothetical protein TIFTF001_045411 [Ficus carica]|uniref:Gnk2-homologous domain-containing protein n=1 Tax=Ficus carica TaxID=3494 RepID=A0AA87YSL4_FICCA|nr:hypothetical protein TIFTF001_045411 [Ficus carica]